ncbi:MAG: SUMF1/EgtB/PvdO family nonheme iron enzyme [Bacteroidales bacterium]|nr:SUMF1/EgtB/PvdO family nonheme iron enzyme [Bacteroidales bacterium]
MKKLVVVLMVITCATAWAEGKKTSQIPLKSDKSVCIDANMVTVADYKAYVDYLRKVSGDAYAEMAMPDADICKSVYGKANIMNEAACQQKPIVGLSWEQIRAYCSWRTDRDNAQSKKGNEYVIYSLPTMSHMQEAFDMGIEGVGGSLAEMTAEMKLIVGAGTYGLKSEVATEEAGKFGFRCVMQKLSRE